MKEIEIKGITLKLGGREITLTIEEGKKLKSALNELFGNEVVKEIHHGWYWNYCQPVVSYYVQGSTTLATTTLSGNIPTDNLRATHCSITSNTLLIEI